MITAQQFNEWRVIPRTMIVMYGYVFVTVWMWFMALPDPSMAQATALTAVNVAGTMFANGYMTSGGSK